MRSGFDWDRHNVGHIARHGVTPEEAEEVILNDPWEQEGVARGGEERTVNIGVWRNRKMRMVTAYPANSKQIAAYRRFRSEAQQRLGAKGPPSPPVPVNGKEKE